MCRLAFVLPLLLLATAPAAAGVGPGAEAAVESGGSYWPAVVLAMLPDGRAVVHYARHGDDSDEIVKPDRLRRLGGGPGKLVVEWGGSWWPAVVLQRHADGRALIRYDGYGPEWDEDVPASRMRMVTLR